MMGVQVTLVLPDSGGGSTSLLQGDGLNRGRARAITDTVLSSDLGFLFWRIPEPLHTTTVAGRNIQQTVT